jgi:bifunctional non-homologous end joining protein LigD
MLTMLIRKNTKAFKSILEIFSVCQDRPDRDQLIRLYITRAGHSIHERINVEGIQGEAALFYEMNYNSILNNLQSPNHQLNVSDEIPGIYFFHSTSNKVWDETPFEFDELIKEEFDTLPELPVVRKKEKPQKFVFPTGKSESKPIEKKPKGKAPKAATAKIVEPGTKQPDYKLKHDIHFTGLEKIIFRQPKIEKKEVLDYYDSISEYLLPYLKDRVQYARRYSGGQEPVELSIEAFFSGDESQVPDWIRPKVISVDKDQKQMLLCMEREQLLFYVESGCLEFRPCHSRTKSLNSPDYMVIAIDSPDFESKKAIEAAFGTKEILDGLQLPSFVKTDGKSGLHVYVPLDAKNKFQTSRESAAYICKLARLKMPKLVAVKGSEKSEYGKVSLDYSLNEENQSLVSPYSLVAGESPVVATPLLWDEVKEDLRLDQFNHQTIFKRLKRDGDPFELFYKKKVNSDDLLDRLKLNYDFLL